MKLTYNSEGNREEKNWVAIILITKTIGTAKIAPSTPPILRPTAKDKIVTRGLMPTTFCITFGTIRLFSVCWTRKYNAVTAKAITGEIVSPINTAGIADIVGPIFGTNSKIAAITANGDQRDAWIPAEQRPSMAQDAIHES